MEPGTTVSPYPVFGLLCTTNRLIANGLVSGDNKIIIGATRFRGVGGAAIIFSLILSDDV
jgi:hypothetical protein